MDRADIELAIGITAISSSARAGSRGIRRKCEIIFHADEDSLLFMSVHVEMTNNAQPHAVRPSGVSQTRERRMLSHAVTRTLEVDNNKVSVSSKLVNCC